ncbi:unnamed protein product [Closterium sp. NIES-65]|nr:unnamed protein product [Closterium sp. NIES-65]
MMTYEASLFVSFGSGFVPRCRPSVRLLSFRQVAVAPSGREEQRKGAIGEALTHLAEEQRKGAIVEALTHFSVLSANAMATGVTTTRMRLQLMKKYSEVQDFWLTEEDVNPSAPPTIHPDLLHYIVTHDPRLSPSPSTRPSTSSPPNASSPPLSPSSSASPPNTPPPRSLTHSRSLADGRTRGRMEGEEGEVEGGREEEEGGNGGEEGGGEGEGDVDEGLSVLPLLCSYSEGPTPTRTSGDGVGGAVQSGDGVGGAVQSGDGVGGAVQSGDGVGGAVQSGEGRCNQARGGAIRRWGGWGGAIRQGVGGAVQSGNLGQTRSLEVQLSSLQASRFEVPRE